MLSYEQEREAQKRFAVWETNDLLMSIETYIKAMSHALGIKEFLTEESPEERRQTYAIYPPVDMDPMSGMEMIPGPAPDGKWNYASMAMSNPLLYDKHRQDWAELELEALKEMEADGAPY